MASESNWAAISGKSDARLLVTEACLPAQHRQPCPFKYRLRGEASQRWYGSRGQTHQTFLVDVATTRSGVAPLAATSNCAANSGDKCWRLLVEDTSRLAHWGHRVRGLVRLETDARQAWLGSLTQSQNRSLGEAPATSIGVSGFRL